MMQSSFTLRGCGWRTNLFQSRVPMPRIAKWQLNFAAAVETPRGPSCLSSHEGRRATDQRRTRDPESLPDLRPYISRQLFYSDQAVLLRIFFQVDVLVL